MNLKKDELIEINKRLRAENERLQALLREKAAEIEAAWAHEQTVEQRQADTWEEILSLKKRTEQVIPKIEEELNTREYEVAVCQERLAEAHRIIEVSEDAQKMMGMETRIKYLTDRLEDYHDALERVRDTVSGKGYGW